MRRLDAIIALLLLGFVAFIGSQILETRRAQRPAAVSAVEPESAVRADVAVPLVRASSLPAPVRNVEGIRQRLRDHGHGTYVGDLLAARDSSLARWSDRRADPIRVWIDERPALSGFDPGFPSEVRRAFTAWGAAGVPLAFAFIPDSGGSEVRVTFVDRFSAAMSGRTLWERDPNWWIVGGTIELSMRSGTGQLLTAPQFHAVALHEVGHLLGLDHTSDTTAIMAPSIRTMTLSPRDVATMRLVYAVPPGPIGGR